MSPNGGFTRARFAAAGCWLACGRDCQRRERVHGINLQKDDSLVLRSVAQSQPGAFGHLFGTGHGASLLAAIGAFGGRRVGVEGDQGVGGESSGGVGDMEATSEVSREVRIGLEMGWERGQRRLSVSPSAGASQVWQAHGHGDQDANGWLSGD